MAFTWLYLVIMVLIPVFDCIIIIHFLKKWLHSKIEMEKRIIHDFITSPGDTPSGLDTYIAEYIAQAVPAISGGIVKSLMATLNQEKGVIQSQFNRAEAEGVEAAIIERFPAAGLILSMMPKKAKNKILKNPGILETGAGLLAGNGNGHKNGNGHSGDKFTGSSGGVVL